MKRRQIEIAEATGDGAALLDGAEKFIALQVCADRAIVRMQLVNEQIHLVEQADQLGAVDVRILLQAGKIGGVPLQFLHDFGLEIATAEDTHNVEQTRQRGTAVPRAGAGQMMLDLLEQKFEPEEGADSFVKWLFVYGFLRHGQGQGQTSIDLGRLLFHAAGDAGKSALLLADLIPAKAGIQ